MLIGSIVFTGGVARDEVFGRLRSGNEGGSGSRSRGLFLNSAREGWQVVSVDGIARLYVIPILNAALGQSAYFILDPSPR